MHYLTVFLRFGPPISIHDYMDQFLSTEEGAARAAAKRLTRDIEQQMIELTINAKDWYVKADTLACRFLMCVGKHSTLHEWRGIFYGQI